MKNRRAEGKLKTKKKLNGHCSVSSLANTSRSPPPDDHIFWPSRGKAYLDCCKTKLGGKNASVSARQTITIPISITTRFVRSYIIYIYINILYVYTHRTYSVAHEKKRKAKTKKKKKKKKYAYIIWNNFLIIIPCWFSHLFFV